MLCFLLNNLLSRLISNVVYDGLLSMNVQLSLRSLIGEHCRNIQIMDSFKDVRLDEIS